MATVNYLRRVPAVKYTGANGAEVSTFANVPIVSDTGPGAGAGSVLKLGDPESGWVGLTFAVGDYFDSRDQAWWYGPDFDVRHITEAAALLDTIGKTDLVSISTPILLLNATADRVITWNRPFSNANYDLSYAFDASTIGRITCAPVAGTKTATGVTIRITATLAVSVVGVVHVLGVGA